MIASLIIWIYILISAYVYGWTIIAFILRFFQIKQAPAGVSKPIIVIVGLCGITVLACVLSLVINLGWLAQSIFLILGLFLAWRMLKTHPRLPSFRSTGVPWLVILLIFLLVFLSVLENGTHGPSNPDTGIYHAQAIRWIETYPAVPGLGNLHSRFAYDSTWLVLNAFFSFSFLGLRSFHLLPGIFVLVALIYFLEGVKNLIEGRISIASIFKALLIPLVFFTVGSQISSPGTDLPTDIFIWVTISLWLEVLENQNEAHESVIGIKAILVFIFSFYMVTIKLSSVPILLLAAYVFFKQFQKNKLSSARLLVFPFLILVPWFARNLILSGYWVYPLPAIAGLSPAWDWKIPLQNVVQEARSILAWARIPRADPDQVLAMPLKSWLKEWFGNLTLNRKILVVLSVFSPFILAISAWFGLRKKTALGHYVIIYSISFAGLIFWLFEAPDIRFGYGVLISTLLLAGVPFIFWLLNKTSLRKIVTYTLIAFIALYQASVLIQSVDVKTLSSRLLLPTDYNALPTLPCNIHGTTLLCAEYYDECGYDTFPCIPPGSASRQVEMRGPSLRDGYRHITIHR